MLLAGVEFRPTWAFFFPWYEIDAFVLCARSSKLWRDKVNPAKNEATQVHA